MHLILLLGILGVAWGVRWTSSVPSVSGADRWQRTMTLFLLPPLLVITSAIAIVWMGPHGQMVWDWEGWISYGIAASFIGFAIVQLLYLAWKGHQTLQQVRAQPITQRNDQTIRVLDSSTLYSAQIGFWKPELVMSQGLLDTLSISHFEAVLAHEQAHYHYRDTFCFFWFGWVRHLTTWLPQTEEIWQELLLLRELRADRWASTRMDSLLLAEALLLVIEQSSFFPETVCAAFNNMVAPNHLAQRIEALLDEAEPTHEDSLGAWFWLLWAALPLLAIPFHH